MVASGRIAIVIGAVAATTFQLWNVATFATAGGDFLPLRHAAQALRSGVSVYGDPTFVYPPTAAVPLLVTAVGTTTVASELWGALSIAALLVAVWQLTRQARPKHAILIGGLSTIALVVGSATTDSLDLGNLSLLLAPVGIAALVAMGRGRWVLGCTVLCASLLVKPLLLPVLVVPLLYGHGRELLRAAVPTAVVLVLSMALIPGGSHFPHVLAYDFSGTNLHGDNAVNNLSIAGWLEAHSVGAGASTVFRSVGVILVVAIAGAALARTRRGDHDVSAIAQSGNLVMLGVLLCGGISEVHFLVVVLASSLLQLAVAPSMRAMTYLLPGIVMLGLPSAYRSLIIGSSAPQTWYLLAEAALLVGTAAAAFTSSVRQPGASPAIAAGVVVATT